VRHFRAGDVAVGAACAFYLADVLRAVQIVDLCLFERVGVRGGLHVEVVEDVVRDTLYAIGTDTTELGQRTRKIGRTLDAGRQRVEPPDGIVELRTRSDERPVNLVIGQNAAEVAGAGTAERDLRCVCVFSGLGAEQLG